MRKEVILVLFMMNILCGCTNDNDRISPATDNCELGVSAFYPNTVAVRSVVDAFAVNDTIGIFVTGTGYRRTLSHYTFDGKKWNPPANFNYRIYLSDETATIYAYYPGQTTRLMSEITDAYEVGVEMPATENTFNCSGQTDYMYATAAYNETAQSYSLATASYAIGHRSASLYFHHAMSKLSFIINKAKNYSGLGKLTQVSLNGVNNRKFKAGSGLMNVGSGTINISTETAALTFSGAASINEYNEQETPDSIITSMLVVPVTTTNNIELYLTLDGTVMKKAMPTTLVNKWEPGKHYTYRVTVSGTEMSINKVEIIGWNEKNGGATDVN